jgi:hypothetical protein
MAVEDRLTGFLRDARDWERKAINIPGVFLLKLPSSRTRQILLLLLRLTQLILPGQLLKREA